MGKHRFIIGAVAALLAGVSLAGAFTAPAQAAEARNCVVVIGKSPAPGKPWPVLSRECGAAAKAVTPQSTLLVQAWEGYNYGGASTQIRGAGGPCDNAGYGIRYVGDEWNDRIRSYKVFNNCNYSSVYADRDWGGYCYKYYGQVPNTVAMDARISSMWLTSGTWAWQLCS